MFHKKYVGKSVEEDEMKKPACGIYHEDLHLVAGMGFDVHEGREGKLDRICSLFEYTPQAEKYIADVGTTDSNGAREIKFTMVCYLFELTYDLLMGAHNQTVSLSPGAELFVGTRRLE